MAHQVSGKPVRNKFMSIGLTAVAACATVLLTCVSATTHAHEGRPIGKSASDQSREWSNLANEFDVHDRVDMALQAAKKDAAKKEDAKKDAAKEPAAGEGKPAADGEGEETPVEAVDADAEAAAKWEAAKTQWARQLNSDSWDLRSKAIDAYAATNHPQAVVALLKVLTSGKPALNQAQRYYLLTKLGTFSNEIAINAVVRAMSKWTKADQLYDIYLVLKGFAASDSAYAQGLISRLIVDVQAGIWVKAGALEAVGESGKSLYMPALMALLDQATPAWDNEEAILPISAMSAIGRVYEQPKDAKLRLPVLTKLRDLLDPFKNGYKNDRVRFWIARTFADVAKLPEATEEVFWIDRYLLEIERGTVGEDGKPPAAMSQHRRTDSKIDFIGMPAVGRRVVFCLDLSDSMNEELDPAVRAAAEEREKKRGPTITGKKTDEEAEKEKEEDKLDWGNINTKLDLAKAYLIRSLKQFAKAERQRAKDLEEWKKEGGKPGPRKSGSRATRSIMEEPFMFNIVVYADKASLLDEKSTSFVAATDKEIERFVKLVQDYTDGAGMTNIHGALLESFRITETKKVPDDPALDSNALLKGADTVFFMTDGWASWSDDSTELDWDERRKNPPPTRKAVGNGKFIYERQISPDFERLNRFRKIIVNTVGIGNHDKLLMMGMARKSKGQYVDFSG